MTIISDTCHSNIVVVMPVSLNMMAVTMDNRHTNHIMVVVLDNIYSFIVGVSGNGWMELE